MEQIPSGSRAVFKEQSRWLTCGDRGPEHSMDGCAAVKRDADMLSQAHSLDTDVRVAVIVILANIDRLLYVPGTSVSVCLSPSQGGVICIPILHMRRHI